MSDPTLFQYCQKIVLFRNGNQEVLLARRKGENDFDGVYSFIGGKLETSDGGFLEGLHREKDEEIGHSVRVRIALDFSYNLYFVKNSGHHMILPHFYAEYLGGEIVLNNEYDDYKWVKISELKEFEPKIKNIPDVVSRLIELNEKYELKEFAPV